MTGVRPKPYRAIAFDAEQIALWYDQGEESADRGHYFDALTYFDAVIHAQPDHVKALVFKAVVLIHLEHYRDALECCDRAVANDPNYSEAWLFRGVALNYLGRYRESYTSYDRALGVNRRSLLHRFLRWLSQLLPAKARYGFRPSSVK